MCYSTLLDSWHFENHSEKFQSCKFANIINFQNVNTHKLRLRNCRINLFIIGCFILIIIIDYDFLNILLDHSFRCSTDIKVNYSYFAGKQTLYIVHIENTTISKIIKRMFWPYVFCVGISVLHNKTDIKVKYFYSDEKQTFYTIF